MGAEVTKEDAQWCEAQEPPLLHLKLAQGCAVGCAIGSTAPADLQIYMPPLSISHDESMAVSIVP